MTFVVCAEETEANVKGDHHYPESGTFEAAGPKSTCENAFPRPLSKMVDGNEANGGNCPNRTRHKGFDDQLQRKSMSILLSDNNAEDEMAMAENSASVDCSKEETLTVSIEGSNREPLVDSCCTDTGLGSSMPSSMVLSSMGASQEIDATGVFGPTEPPPATAKLPQVSPIEEREERMEMESKGLSVSRVCGQNDLSRSFHSIRNLAGCEFFQPVQQLVQKDRRHRRHRLLRRGLKNASERR
jgi:hypothetical protein